MSKVDLVFNLLNSTMDGFIIGLDRSTDADKKFVSHIYRGTFSDPTEPMCPRGWNRNNGNSFSIWRSNLGRHICRDCLRNTLKELNNSKEDSHGNHD